MKPLILLALLASKPALAAPAIPSNPFENKCSTEEMSRQVQSTIIKDLRARVKAEQAGKSAFTFLFTSPFADPKDHDLTIAVYFETVSGMEQETRRAYVSAHTLDPETCAPTFRKMQLLVGGTYASAERLSNPMGEKENCNFADGQETFIKDVLNDAKWLSPQNMPGSMVTNFAITGVSRVEGAADVMAVYEAARPNLLSTPTLVQSTVDPKTCRATMRVSTSFTTTLVRY